jgi:hypothetical protein
MGGVVDFVSDVFEGAGDFVGDVIESVGDIALDVVREVGNAVVSIGEEAGKIAQAAINDPIGTIAKVAAIATQQYWALPLISAATVVASGGDLMQAALAAGISYAGMEIASGLTDYLAGPAFDSVASMAAQDAVSLSAQGLSAGQIADVLGQSYQLGSNVASSMAAAAAAGIPAATVATAYAGAFGEQLNGVMTTASQKILQGAAGNGVANAAMTIARGGDPTEALISSLTGAAGTVVGGNANIGLRELGANAAISNVLGATAGAATKGLLSGQDFTTATGSALINNIINTTLSESGKAIKNSEFAQGVKNQFNSLIEGAKGFLDSSSETAKAENAKLLELSRENEGIITQAKSIQDEAEDYRTNTLTPAQQAAEKAYEVAMSSYDEYKSVTDKFGDLVTRYDQAKAAGNTALANQLADEANALIPDINTKTAAYNSDFNAYDAAKNDFAAKNDTFTGYANKLTELNTKYLEVNNRANEQAKVVESAATTFEEARSQFENNVKQVIADTETAQNTVSDYSTDAQKAFERAFASGKNALDAADFAGELNSKSSTAQKAFNQAFDQGLDVQDAFELSQQINAMPKTAQNYYEFATSFGLKPTDAAGIVTDVSGMSNIAQQVFFDNLAEKYDTESALSAAQNVNSLNAAQQSTYFNAKLNGLDPELAMNAAKEVGGLSRDQQNTYINNLRNGVDPQTAKFLAALQLDKTAAVDINQANLAKLTSPEQRDAYNISIASGMSPTKALESVLDLFVSEAQAGAGGLPPTPTPDVDPSKIREAVYHQDPATGRWGIYIPDSQGNLKDTGIVLATGGTFTPAQEGKLTGDKFIVDESVTENGVPALSMTPYTGASSPTTTGGASNPFTKSELASELAAGEITQAEYDKYIITAKDDRPVTEPLVNPVIQDYINNLFSSATPQKTIATTPSPGATTTPNTVPSTGTNTTGTATDTTGVPGTAPTTSGGSTTGEAPSGGTGTGSATTGGATPGTGTGAGGTGTAGTGTTGTGTGGGGTGGGGTGGVGGTGGGMGGGYSSWSAVYGGQDQYGGIKNLTPGLTERMDYNLSGLPTDINTNNPMMEVPEFSTGGSSTYNPFSTKDAQGSGISGSLAPGLSKAQINYILTGLPGNNVSVPGKAEGGSIPGHYPEFYSEGGLSSMENRYVEGEGDGTSDSVPAMLANGEFVIPADVVSKIGNGSNEAGAGVLDQFLVEIRKHAHSNGEKLPPESKGPLGYLLDAKRKVKA